MREPKVEIKEEDGLWCTYINDKLVATAHTEEDAIDDVALYVKHADKIE